MSTAYHSNQSEISKLPTLVEGDPKALFSIATTLRCSGGRYSIPWIALLYPWSLPNNADAKQGSTIFWVFDMTRPRIEPRSSGPLANTQLIRPMARLIDVDTSASI